jgi:hypothetical protein
MADDTNTKQPANKREESEERGWLSNKQAKQRLPTSKKIIS